MNGIGEIVETLDQEGLRDDTFVFFQSDNGATIEDRAGLGGRNTPFRGFKFSLFEGGIRMPAIANWPGVLPAGETTLSTRGIDGPTPNSRGPMRRGSADRPHCGRARRLAGPGRQRAVSA